VGQHHLVTDYRLIAIVVAVLVVAVLLYLAL
jgi:hypothetical protein